MLFYVEFKDAKILSPQTFVKSAKLFYFGNIFMNPKFVFHCNDKSAKV